VPLIFTCHPEQLVIPSVAKCLLFAFASLTPESSSTSLTPNSYFLTPLLELPHMYFSAVLMELHFVHQLIDQEDSASVI
jgi:hypothetical protein